MKLLSALMFVSLLSGCASVPPGNVVLAVDLLTSDDSSRYSIIRGGRFWPGLSPNTDFYEIATTEQRDSWSRDPVERHPIDESITFAGGDGQPVNVDIGIGYIVSPTDESIIGLARKYGPDINAVIDSRVRDSTRDALNRCASQYSVEQIYGEQKGVLMDCVLTNIKAEYDPTGLIVTRLTQNSQIRLPPKVTEAMESRITASANADKIRREVETIKAEGEKKVAEASAEAEALLIAARSKSEADGLRSQGITPEIIRLKQLENEYALIQKWNGVLPSTVLDDGSIPMIQLTQGK